MRPTLGVSVFVALFLVIAIDGRARAGPEPGSEKSGRGGAPAGLQPETYELPVLTILGGGGPRFQRIQLKVGDGAGGIEPRDFQTGAYFDFGWFLLARPAARKLFRPSVQAIVLQLSGGAGVGLKVEPSGTGISLQTRTWRLLGQFGYLYPMGRVQVGGFVGLGADLLRIDLNSVLPSSRIIYFRLGPAVTYQIVEQLLHVRVDLGLRAPFVLDGLSDAFGNDASGMGMDAALMFNGRLENGFSYAFRLVWEYYWLRFGGASASVPAAGEGADGGDNAITLQFLVGWSL